MDSTASSSTMTGDCWEVPKGLWQVASIASGTQGRENALSSHERRVPKKGRKDLIPKG